MILKSNIWLLCGIICIVLCSGKTETPKCVDATLTKLLVMNGTIAHLPCTVGGSPFPTIEWRKDGKKLEIDDRYSITENGLTIRNVQLADKGKYQVTLSNIKGSIIFQLDLEVKTIDDVEPANYKNVVEGKPIDIECGKTPIKPGDKVTWSKGEKKDLKLLPRFTVNDKGYLHISETKKTDSGFYICASTRKENGGDLTYSVNMYLNVEYAPVINSIKKEVLVYLGHDAELPCNAIGIPDVYHRWKDQKGAVIKNQGRFKIASNGSLLISKVELKDGMNYTCAPYNDVGDGNPRHSSLVILIAPKFISQQPTTTYELETGKKVTLDCSASGIPKPNVTWNRTDIKGEDDPIINRDIIYTNVGLLIINEVKVSDVGVYNCRVQSLAGEIYRTITIKKVVGKPEPPTEFAVYTRNDIAYVTWKPSYDGGSNQDFEIWYRESHLTDYQWKQITSAQNTVRREVTISAKSSKYFFSMRARNSKGYGRFTYVVEVGRRSSTQANGVILKQISAAPLAPESFSLNMTKEGYNLNWNIINTPGRPSFQKIVIQYRHANSSNSWKTFKLPRNMRKRRAIVNNDGMFINAKDITDERHPLEFQIFALAANGAKSAAKKPDPGRIIIKGMPGGEPGPGRSKGGSDPDLVPPIVLGVIFGVFIIVLLISLYCFCRRKKGRYQAGKNQKKTVEYSKQRDVIDVEAKSLEATEQKKLLEAGLDSPRKFHFRTCPALKLGKFTNYDSKNEDVHALLEPHAKEELVCTCNKKYLTLSPEDVRNIKQDKKGLFKSSSSPNVFVTSDNEKSSLVDPSELLDEEQYDISDCEKDEISDLKNISTLNRSKFKDSYDQFCKPNGVKSRLSSTNSDKAEVDKNLVDGHDNLSENSATESECPLTPRDGKPCDKSSGYGDGSNTTSDSESIQDKPGSLKPAPYNGLKYPSEYSKRDMGYVSDISTRSSPLDHIKHKLQQPPRHKLGQKNYFSDDEYDRPRAPPSYKQAIDDIERMSEINEITDSEDMYDQLIEMEKKLGVQLDDSLESDINSQGLSSLPPSMRDSFRNNIPGNYNNTESGYMSDIGFNRDRYSDREKSERCAKLLNEFKSSRNARNSPVSSDTEVPMVSPTVRSKSVMDNIAEEPRLPPVLRRSNSAGSSSVYNEWLV